MRSTSRLFTSWRRKTHPVSEPQASGIDSSAEKQASKSASWTFLPDLFLRIRLLKCSGRFCCWWFWWWTETERTAGNRNLRNCGNSRTSTKQMLFHCFHLITCTDCQWRRASDSWHHRGKSSSNVDSALLNHLSSANFFNWTQEEKTPDSGEAMIVKSSSSSLNYFPSVLEAKMVKLRPSGHVWPFFPSGDLCNCYPSSFQCC